MIVGNVIGAHTVTPKTFIFQDEYGNEVEGVLVEKETIFTATTDDIREGKIAAVEGGVVTGDKFIPAYHTSEGIQVIPSGSEVKITSLQNYGLHDFTKLQAIICDFNTTTSDSVSAQKISVNENVYSVQSIEPLSAITKNDEEKTVDFGITNDSGELQILRFFTYKDIG